MTLLPEYRAQLHGAAQRHAHRRVRRPTAGRVPAVAAVLVAVGVVVAGVAVLRPRSAPAPGGATRSAAPTRQLIDALGVLRRPQTGADLLSARPTGAGGLLPGYFGFPASRACRGLNQPVLLCSVRLDASLIRSVGVRAYRVGIFPATAKSAAALIQPSVGVVMGLRGPGIYYADSGPRLTSVATLRRQGLIVSAYVASGVDRGVMLVPDGVARVALGSFRLVAPWLPKAVRIGATSAMVNDNVALFQLDGLTEKGLGITPSDLRLRQFFSQGSGRGCRIDFAVYGLPAAARMTWFDARGRVVRDITIRFLLYVGTQHPAPGSVGRLCAGRR